MHRVRIHLRRRGDIWYVDARINGRRIKESTGTTKRAEAEQYLERRRAQLGDPTHVPAPKTQDAYSVRDAVGDFCELGLSGIADGTARMYKSKAGHINRLLGRLDMTALTARDLLGYVEVRSSKDEGAKPHTIHKELVTLRRVMRFAEEHGKILPGWQSLIPKLSPAYQPQDRWLTLDEYSKLLAAIVARPKALLPERRAWLVTAVYTGARDSELRDLDWRQVDADAGFVHIRSAKTRKGKAPKIRHVPIAAELRAALAAFRDVDGKLPTSGPVFPHAWQNSALELGKASTRAGIPHVCTNHLRHTFASWMLQRGATVKEVADLLGHGSTALVERIYGHLARENYIAAIDRMPVFGPRAADAG